MQRTDLEQLVLLLEEKNRALLERERELADGQEELLAQKEELTAAIEELMEKNNSLNITLHQLRQRNHELDQILYRTSHDLRTPVTSIIGLLNMMKSEREPDNQAFYHEHLALKAKQMNELLDSLSILAQASFNEIAPEKIDIEALLTQAIQDLNYLQKFNSVSIKLSAQGIKEFRSDKRMILILFKCLLSNAIIFRDIEKPGNVSIEVKNFYQGLEISITDDGEGILPEIGDRIFEMFFRGSERSQGSGLGLYIVSSLIERLSGQIHWKSVPGETTFTFTLPEISL